MTITDALRERRELLGLTQKGAALLVLLAVAMLAGPPASSSATSAVANPWTGEWSRPAAEFGGSSAGVTTLTQNGSSVTGSYDWHGGGTISGTASGSTLDGTWSESAGSGTFHLTISADALSFSGTTQGMTGAFKGLSGSWTGTYSGTRSAPVTTTPSKKPWPAAPDATVSLASVSNGCGGGEASEAWRHGDKSTFRNSNNPLGKRYVVDFREACNLHDAGYSGAKVADPINGGVVDYYGWTQRRVDDKFLDDMQKLCDTKIPADAAVALADCKAHGGKTSFGAKTRYDFVREHGHHFYRDRPNLTSPWSGASLPTFVIHQRLRAVKVTWPGGEFRGTVISRDQDSVIEGIARVTTGSKTRSSKLSFTVDPDTPNKIRISGAGYSGTLHR